MIKHHLKIAWRNLRRQKVTSLLNILGLTVGLVSAILIFEYVTYEKSYDRFHHKGDRIYRVSLHSYQDGKLTERSATSYPAIGPAVKNEIPEVTDYCRLLRASGVIGYENNYFRETNGYFSDGSVMEVFTIPLLQGQTHALDSPGSIIISEEMKEKYFGQESAMNKTIYFENEPYTVKGIFKDYPHNSHLKIDYLLSYLKGQLAQSSWRWSAFYTYLVISPETDIPLLEEKIGNLLTEHNIDYYNRENRKDAGVLQPLKAVHLQPGLTKEAEAGRDPQTLFLLLITGMAILSIVWINYINLSIASNTHRIKEIAVNKMLGGSRKNLVQQFFLEALLLNVTAILLSALIIRSGIPFIAGLTERPDDVLFRDDGQLILLLALIFVIGMTITGVFPAMVFTKFKPANILKGMLFSNYPGRSLQKALIVFQFTWSVILISATIVIYHQLGHMTQKNLGFEPEQIVVVRGANVIDSITQRNGAFKNEVLNSALVSQLSVSAFVPGQEISWIRGIKRKDTMTDQYHTFRNTAIDDQFANTYKIKVIAGRNFSKDFPNDIHCVLLNEEAVKSLGFDHPEQVIDTEIINGDRDPDTLRVIGVFENFQQRSPQFAQEPIVFLFRPDEHRFYSCKIATSILTSAIGFIKDRYQDLFPGAPFEYFFMDDYFDRQYSSEKKFGTLFTIFTLIAICISCLGLFAVVHFLILNRIKEIGIRKVLGASVASVVALLSKDFIRLVLVAIIIATPIAWYAMNRWLQGFAYRIELQWWMFAGAGLVALVIAMVTVSGQSVRAAMANPVNSLRTE